MVALTLQNNYSWEPASDVSDAEIQYLYGCDSDCLPDAVEIEKPPTPENLDHIPSQSVQNFNAISYYSIFESGRNPKLTCLQLTFGKWGEDREPATVTTKYLSLVNALEKALAEIGPPHSERSGLRIESLIRADLADKVEQGSTWRLSTVSITRACEALAAFSSLPYPDIGLTDRGGVLLDWNAPGDATLTLECVPDGRIFCSYLLAAQGDELPTRVFGEMALDAAHNLIAGTKGFRRLSNTGPDSRA